MVDVQVDALENTVIVNVDVNVNVTVNVGIIAWSVCCSGSLLCRLFTISPRDLLIRIERSMEDRQRGVVNAQSQNKHMIHLN